MKDGQRLRRTAKESSIARSRRKLLAKTSWYKKQKTEDLYGKSSRGRDWRSRRSSWSTKQCYSWQAWTIVRFRPIVIVIVKVKCKADSDRE